ncbi:MFS transporter [Schlesneria sp. DSM 10557]|uniref:MFS transporter n=1 Tax=Schlesneria sp. DSM 10557 TaxID=3044399 RepID=UPI0035A0678D
MISLVKKHNRPRGSNSPRFNPASSPDETPSLRSRGGFTTSSPSATTAVAAPPAIPGGRSNEAADASPIEAPVDRETAPSAIEMATNGLGLKRNLQLSIGDGSSYGVMVGIGETYLQAFVLAIGMGEVFAALIATVPQLVGSLLQLVSPAAIRLIRSHKWWVAACAGIQALCFLPLIIAASTGTISHSAILAVTSLYWATSLGAGPAWNTWQGTIIPRDIRAKFFARRARLCQATTLAGFLGGGFALQWARAHGVDVPVFAILFGIALVCRLVSTLCLMCQSEPAPIPAEMRFLSLGEQWERFSRGSSGRLLVFAVGMQVGVFVAGPFFVPYMLKELNFQYHHYAILIGASYVAKFLTLRLWGRIAHRTGAHRLLWIGSLGLIPLAGGWCLSSNYVWLFVLQLIAGTAWGAYELALVLLFFETIQESERTSLLTLYNVANSVALVVGSLIGAVILNGLGICAASYLWVFVASTAFRALALVLLKRVPVPRAELERAAAVVTPRPVNS